MRRSAGSVPPAAAPNPPRASSAASAAARSRPGAVRRRASAAERRHARPSAGWSRSCSSTWCRSPRSPRQRDAEDMRALMDAYFETARTVIERHGGVVEKFIGDAVMAVWGTPVTHEDDAERAVRAGAGARGRGRRRSAPSMDLAAAGSRRRADGGGGHLAGRRRQPGHGHRRHGEHRVPAAVGRRAGPGVRGRGHVPRRLARRSRSTRWATLDAEGQGGAGPRMAGPARRRRASGRQPDGGRAAVRRPHRGAPAC